MPTPAAFGQTEYETNPVHNIRAGTARCAWRCETPVILEFVVSAVQKHELSWIGEYDLRVLDRPGIGHSWAQGDVNEERIPHHFLKFEESLLQKIMHNHVYQNAVTRNFCGKY